MEKDIKYYTPTIEEFYVGFEYEFNILKDNKWKDFKFLLGDEFNSLYELDEDINNNLIRVKYLDEQDIIDLKFIKENCLDAYYKDEIKEGFKLSIDDNTTIVLIKHGNNKISIVKEYCYNDYSGNTEITFLFYGIIKNKSELKKALKMLNIK